MTPTTTEVKKTQRTVFDLAAFDDVTLVKLVTLPTPPASIEDALVAVGNDSARLLKVIHEGLCAETVETARATIEGFSVPNEDGEPGEPYTGKFADEDQGKKINAAILALAKMQGYEKSLAPEKKKEIRANVIAFLRANPAMLGGLTQ